MPMLHTLFALLATLLLSACVPPESTNRALIREQPEASSAAPPTRPMLRIDPGMHQAPIRGIAVDREERFLVTASEDKTAKVWDLGSGALLATLRPPIGEDANEGKLYAVAISPDGATVAVGGYTGHTGEHNHSIYLFDRASGRLTERISGLPNVICHLAFSPDGRSLAATLFGNNGLRVYSSGDWRQVFADTDYGADSYGVDFDRRGRLVTSSMDGFIRLYDPALRLLAKVQPPGGAQPFGVAFSPDDMQVAVGFHDHDTPAVNLLDGDDLRLLANPDTSGVNANLINVAWSRDGAWLYAGGRADRGGQHFIRRWAKDGAGAFRDFPVATDTITNLRPLQAGRLAFGAGDPAWGVLGPTGTVASGRPPVQVDLRVNWEGFRLASDGNRVGFGLEYGGKRPVVFDLAVRALTPGASGGLTGSRLDTPDLRITDWKNTLAPTLNGQPLQLMQNEISRSLAIAPDDQSFLLGADGSLHRFDRRGHELWQQSVPGEAWAVNVSPDGRLAVAGYGDGTVRWHRMSDGKELLALFVTRDGTQWVAWTPSGYYMASPGGERLIGWHVNRGPDHEADFYPVSQLRSNFYRPEVVARVLSTLDEDEAVRLAGAQAAPAVAQVLPPVVEVLAPKDGAVFLNPQVTLRYRARSDAPLRSVKVLVDGRPLSAERGLARERPAAGTEQTITLNLPARDVTLSLIAENANGASLPATIKLRWAGAAAPVAQTKPNLYVLAIGVGDYQNPGVNKLRYPAKDAQDFTTVLQGQKDGLYGSVIVKTLPDADRAAMLAGLGWLKGQVTERDVTAVFLAGHGYNDPNGNYWFITRDTDPEHVPDTAVAQAQIREALSVLPSKVLAFIDTCHAGNVMAEPNTRALMARAVDINGLIMDLTSAENGVITFASSTGTQNSLEDARWNNGAFTKALVEGLAGSADMFNEGKITVNGLDFYVSHRVAVLTDNRQTPTTRKPGTIPDFPVAVTR